MAVAARSGQEWLPARRILRIRRRRDAGKGVVAPAASSPATAFPDPRSASANRLGVHAPDPGEPGFRSAGPSPPL